MRKLLALAALVLVLPLASCGFTSYGDIAREAVAEYGAKGADALLENSEFAICRAAPVGAVMRRYGSSAELAEAWRTLCLRSAQPELFEPEPEAAPSGDPVAAEAPP